MSGSPAELRNVEGGRGSKLAAISRNFQSQNAVHIGATVMLPYEFEEPLHIASGQIVVHKLPVRSHPFRAGRRFITATLNTTVHGDGEENSQGLDIVNQGIVRRLLVRNTGWETGRIGNGWRRRTTVLSRGLSRHGGCQQTWWWRRWWRWLWWWYRDDGIDLVREVPMKPFSNIGVVIVEPRWIRQQLLFNGVSPFVVPYVKLFGKLLRRQ